MPLAHLAPPAPTLARAFFWCPFSKRAVTATFQTVPGAGRPVDVESCSVFGAGAVRCKKRCLALATARTMPSPMIARYALLAGGESHRDPPPGPGTRTGPGLSRRVAA